jgi:hypothetical protein
VTERELALRRSIFAAFAATGEAPEVADEPALRGLADQHVVVLDDRADARPHVRMAHPFAGHHEAARVEAGGRTWWGNCAWDGLGIVAALRLADADVVSNGVTLRVREGRVAGGAVFHVAVPARDWWADIGFT